MGTHKFSIDDREFEVEVGTRRGTTVPVTVNGKSYTVELKSEASAMALRATPSTPPPATAAAAPAAAPAPAPAAVAEGAGVVRAPMAGLVLAVKVKVGDVVEEGTTLLLLEAMKMENAITAHVAGTVKSVTAQPQQTVNQGDPLVEIG